MTKTKKKKIAGNEANGFCYKFVTLLLISMFLKGNWNSDFIEMCHAKNARKMLCSGNK